MEATPSNTTLDPRAQAVAILYRDRRLAHRRLFTHRHSNATPPFHDLLIDDWHGGQARICEVVFRGGAKSTIGEEGIILNACFREFKHGLILGSSLDRACERLHAIRREFERNEELNALFGPCRGQPWGDELIELAWGVTIRAMGRGQSLRGTKHDAIRPDLVFADDIEDIESVRTEESRKKVQDWFMLEVLPAADPGVKVRIAANMLDPQCLAKKLQNPKSGFRVRVIPWEYIADDGQRAATWPDRFPLDYIDRQREMYYALGDSRGYKREFMCEAEAPEEQVFRPDMKRIEPRVRTWEAVYCMVDPARTVSRQAATTGFAAWSWIGPKFVIWDAWAKQLMPDQILNALFETEDTYHPIKIGFEEDGLEEWARQPIREEQRKRGIMLPLQGVRAPRGKLDFIRALQPYFQAREALFAKDCPEAWSQFLGFPGGLIDAPNALAYALHPKLKAGIPLYEEFTTAHVAPDLLPSAGTAAWLALHADKQTVAGVLLQMENGTIRILADWLREGSPDQVAAGIVQDANLEAMRTCRIVLPPSHYERFLNVGLQQELKRHGLNERMGGTLEDGCLQIRAMLKTQSRGVASLLVAERARAVLNGFAGGYCRASSRGDVADHAEEGPYKLVMEAVECCAALLRLGADEDDGARTNAVSKSGQPYFSVRPQR